MNKHVLYRGFVLILFLGSLVLLFFLKFDSFYISNEFNLIRQNKFKLIYFFIFCVITSFVTIPLGVFTKILSGWLFGFIGGSIYSTIGLTVGSYLSFKFIKKTNLKLYEINKLKFIKRFDENLKKNGLVTVAQIRIFPFFPLQASNYLLGLTQVNDFNFIFGTLLGVIPASIFYSWIGSSLVDFTEKNIDYKTAYQFSIFLLLLFFILFLFRHSKIKALGDKLIIFFKK